MSSAAIGFLLIGIALLVAAMLGALIWDRSEPAADQINDATELAYWQEQANAIGLDFGLAATRAAAGKWAASAAAILGILATVAIVAGPSDLVDDVGGTEADVAAVLVLVAGGMAALATLLAGLAEQGSPMKGGLTPGKVRALTRVRAERAATQIRWSRILTAFALVLIVAAAGIAWLTALTGDENTSPQSAIVVSGSGAKCGNLAVADGVLMLSVAGVNEEIPRGAQVTLVSSCPS